VIGILLTALGISGLFLFGRVFKEPNEVRRQAKYQMATLLMALLLMSINRAIYGSSISFNSNLDSEVKGLSWIGFSKETTWTSASQTFLIIPFLVTTTVVYLQALKGMKVNGVLSALFISIPFSLMNSATEEVIFRLIGIESLPFAAVTTSIICGAWFGIPHYFGTPGKIPGVLMAGLLGYVMALAMQQTGGFLLPWMIHFVQDVPIIAMLILKSRTQSS
jgi:hypothetical protein